MSITPIFTATPRVVAADIAEGPTEDNSYLSAEFFPLGARGDALKLGSRLGRTACLHLRKSGAIFLGSLNFPLLLIVLAD